MMGHVAHPALSQFPYAFDYTNRLTKESCERKGYGGFADVYQFRNPRNGLLYAVKEIVNAPRSLTLLEVAKIEYDIWHRLRHPNILQLEGIYLAPHTPIPSFVTRWQENGRVKNYVQGKPETDFLGLIEDVAEGVTYLHGNDIIHGDLRAANILISDDCRALVTDFGISKHDPGDGITLSRARQGNCRWMAREFFVASTARRSKASDIWMFGIEILSGKNPYYYISNERLIESMIENGELSEFPNAQHTSWRKFDDPVQELRLRYCASEPTDRPAITSVLQDIRKVLFNVASFELAFTDLQNIEEQVSEYFLL
ncbi:kinase-like protein [Sanghuangporus baumii]|uniref:Kinase-like protein n=1 Tax=Sanghuangporus baumii TaxID=108892 RepID=A0A9Q5I5W0_SANBA|nr:kinase-like protein [Sanghuangporus baumii]